MVSDYNPHWAPFDKSLHMLLLAVFYTNVMAVYHRVLQEASNVIFHVIFGAKKSPVWMGDAICLVLCMRGEI